MFLIFDKRVKSMATILISQTPFFPDLQKRVQLSRHNLITTVIKLWEKEKNVGDHLVNYEVLLSNRYSTSSRTNHEMIDYIGFKTIFNSILSYIMAASVPMDPYFPGVL